MKNADPWRPFQEVMEAPLEWARAWKARTGGRVIGHLLPDVPEEILHAAGALPLALEGAPVQVSHAQAHIPGYTCAHAMGLLEMGLRGQLEFLDGMVIPYVCDTTRNLFHIWSYRFPKLPSEFLRLPKRVGHPGAREYLKAEYGRLFQAMNRVTGCNGDVKALSQSIRLYNRSRARLREAYRMHQRHPEVWSATRLGLLLGSAMKVPREEHLTWMEALPWAESGAGAADGRIPIYVRGKIWDPPGILGLMDELALKVAEDEMVTGFRVISRDAKEDGDPLDALAMRHMEAVPYPGYHVEPAQTVRGFLARVKGSKARGVLFLNPKFCEEAGFDLPDLEKGLQDAKIPSLVLETSARGVSLGQLRVRLEAFREILAGELP
jgi:benzoyl-CoA reductase subunit C